MTAPHRIQRKRERGWRMPGNAVYVGRPTKWGNPWRVVSVHDSHFPFGTAYNVVTADGTSAGRFADLYNHPGTGATYWATRMYSRHLAHHPDLRAAAVSQLAGHDLACWCPIGRPCHADVLLEYVTAVLADMQKVAS